MKQVEIDKQKHLIYGYLIVAVLSLFINPLIAFAVCFIVGICKEVIWDKWLGKGQFEYADMYYTWFGGIMALLPQIMYMLKS